MVKDVCILFITLKYIIFQIVLKRTTKRLLTERNIRTFDRRWLRGP